MRLARSTWIKTAFALCSGLACEAAAAALPIELISVNTLGQQATLSFGNERNAATNSTSGISFDGARIGYITRDRSFALDGVAPFASIYAQLMQWRRAIPGSVKSVQAPVGQTTVTASTFDKPGSEFCFKAIDRDYVTGKQHGSNFFCKQADGSYQYAGAFGPNNYLPSFVTSFRGGAGFDISKFNYDFGDTGFGFQVAVRDRSSGAIDFVSVNNQGDLAFVGANISCNQDASFWPYAEVSNDGRYALFDSCAPNLVPGDSSVSREGTDLFVRDRVLRTTTRIMRDDGQEFSGSMYDYDLSRDGRFAVFAADGLMTQDCAELFGPHAYLYEIATGRLECISRDVNGELTDNAIFQVAARLQISDDARFMAYTTRAALDPRDTNNVPDVYLYDRIKRRSVLISDTHDGQVSNDWSTFPLISGDGNWVVFQSFASNLIPNDQNGRIADVFVRDLRPLRAGELPITPVSTLSVGSLVILVALTLGFGVFGVRRWV